MSQDYLRSLIERNSNASTSWQPMPTIKDMQAWGTDKKLTIIVTCADPRADPSMYLGLNQGEIPTIRNAGGRVTEDVLTSIELMSTIGLAIGLLLVIHHTDCGGLYMTDNGIRSTLSERSPEHAHSIEHKTWHAFHDIGMSQSIHDDVSTMKKWLNGWRFLPEDTPVGGYVFDIKTGQLQEVVAAEFK